MAHRRARGDPVLLERVVPSVHGQLQECLFSPGQRDRPPFCPTTPGTISVFLHLMVLLGSQHHPSSIQCICLVAFHQGVRHEKMLEKLTTHDIKDVAELFSLADKCARAVEGHAWHTSPVLKAGKDSKPNTGTAAQGGDNNNNNKKRTSTPAKRPAVMMAAPVARCITLCATVRVSVERSRSLQNSSARNSSNRIKKVRLLASGRANKKLILKKRRTKKWHSRTIRGR
jgi:hypothetical protein